MRRLSATSCCVLCGITCLGELALCPSCQFELAPNSPACLRCALALGLDSPSAGLCGQCQSNPPAFAHCYPIGDYSFPLRQMIARFKFQGHFNIGHVLSQMLARRLRPEFSGKAPDLLIPIPLHSARLRERGFNQSIEIVRHLSRHFGTPYAPNYCKRIRASKPQRGLSASERKANVQGIFKISPQAIRIKPRHIVIVDDVVTTMATVNAIACLLQKEGVERIDVACIARVS